MKAMILAAGKGERLLPLTQNTPKPLIKVGGKTLIERQIEKLVCAGLKDIVINVSYLSQQIIHYLKDGNKFGCKIEYCVEKEPLETLGGICNAIDLLDDEFIVINSDLYTDYDYKKLINLSWESKNLLAHLVLIKGFSEDFSIDSNGYGCINTSNNTKQEKFTFSGIACYKKEFFNSYLRENKKSPLDAFKVKLAPYLFEQANKKNISAEVYQGIWYDVGTISRLQQLNEFLANN